MGSVAGEGRTRGFFPESWDHARAVYEEQLLEYHSKRGADLNSPQVKANVDNNTVSVPARGDHLIRMLNELADLELSNKTVLDVGCGFGALASYLVWRADPARLVATDINDNLLSVARDCAYRTEFHDQLRFVKADMRDLSPLGGDRFDIAIANGVIFYALNRQDFRQALSELHRVLTPGGCVLFYHSNKWRWTDPFTQAPLVHLLPRRVSPAVSRLTGWKSSHGWIRLVSPVELRRSLRALGFRDIKVIGFGKQRRHVRGPARFFGQRYVLSARRGT